MSAYQPTSPGDILECSLVRGPVGGEALPARRVRAGGSRPQTLKPSTKRFPAATNRLPTLSGGKTARWPKSRRHLSHLMFATTANVVDMTASRTKFAIGYWSKGCTQRLQSIGPL